jgi:transcriptional regulator with XRE-family HTH domain
MTAKQSVILAGEQIRFLRKYLGWSREEFAAIMGVEGETISRWENNKAKMGKAADRLLRVFVFTQNPAEEYHPQELAQVGKKGKPTMMRVAAGVRSWDAAPAAAAL